MYTVNMDRILANKSKICTECNTTVSSKEHTKQDLLREVCKKYNRSFNNESTLEFDYLIESSIKDREFQFEYQTIDLFCGDEDITLEEFQSYITNARALYSNEVIIEGPADVSRKVANKVSTGVRKLDQKASGKGRSIKKGVDKVDKSLSSFVNNMIERIRNIGQEDAKEKLITGHVSVKLGKLLRNTIRTLAGAGAANMVLGPVSGSIVTIVGLLTAYACNKRTKEREKKRILLELETELKIVKEKVEDAKGENDKKQKYELMRTQAILEKEITRIKYNLRPY